MLYILSCVLQCTDAVVGWIPHMCCRKYVDKYEKYLAETHNVVLDRPNAMHPFTLAADAAWSSSPVAANMDGRSIGGLRSSNGGARGSSMGGVLGAALSGALSALAAGM